MRVLPILVAVLTVVARVAAEEPIAGGKGGGPFQEQISVGWLVGVNAWAGNWAGHHIVTAVQPIFRTPEGVKPGAVHGKFGGSAAVLMARPGYAVGGMSVTTGDRVDGFRFTFMKIVGEGLDATDSYESEWVGGNVERARQLGSRGLPVIGLRGASGQELNRIGLIVRGNAPAVATAPAPSVPSVPSAPAAPRPAPAKSAGEYVQQRGGTMVIIKGARGSGSGFLATLAGKTYLLTNAHVLAGVRQPRFTLLDGTELTATSIEAAVGHDLVRVGLQNPPPVALEVGGDLSQTTRIGDEVFVFGNSGGGGVVTSLRGKLLGIGPDRIEVDSAFIPGNSGSPIIHAPTGRVIGIATYLTRSSNEFGELYFSGGRFTTTVVRRFGYRIDSVKTWQPVNLAGFEAEAAQLEKVEELTKDILNFLEATRSRQAPALETESLRRAALEWREKTTRRGVSENDRRSATQSFLGTLRSLSRGDVATLEQTLRYDYFRRELGRQREIRDQLYTAFNKEAQALGSPSR